jgi:hypothetical protein
MVVHRVRQVIGWKTVRFHDDNILIVFRKLALSAHQVGHRNFGIKISVRFETNNAWRILLERIKNVLDGFFTTYRPSSIVPGAHAPQLLLAAHILKLLMRTKTGVRTTLFEQRTNIRDIDRSTRALGIRAVQTDIPSAIKRPLIGNNAIMGKGRYDQLRRAGKLAFSVGILDTEVKNTSALASEPLADQSGIESSDMQKTRWAWSDACHHRTGRQCAGGVFFLDVPDAVTLPWKQPFDNFLIVWCHEIF